MTPDRFIETLTRTLPQWLRSMETGRLKYRFCRHSYEPESLDAISLAYDLRQMTGIGFTEVEKDLAKKILDSYQTGSENFFYEKNHQKIFQNTPIHRAEEMHGNYITFQAMGAYKAIDRLPEKAVTFYDPFIQAKGIFHYLDNNCPWGRSPWGAGGMVDNLGTILDCNLRLGEKKYQDPIRELLKWVDERQDPETGLWGSRDVQGLNGLVNGGYHLIRGTYLLQKEPLKHAEKIIDSILLDLKENLWFTPLRANGCQDLDHFFLLDICSGLFPDHRNSEIKMAAESRLKNIIDSVFSQDGGFSFERDNAVKKHNYMEISPGIKESDIQGSVFYLQTVKSICNILGFKTPFGNSCTHG